MSEDRKAEIITAAVMDCTGQSKECPSIKFKNEDEESLYKCCLVAIKLYIRQ